MTEKQNDNKIFTTKNIFICFLLSIGVALIYYMILSPIFTNEDERRLQKEYNQLTDAYDSLNDKFQQTKGVLAGLERKDSIIYSSIFKTMPVNFIKANRNNVFVEDIKKLELKKLTSVFSEKIDTLSQQIKTQNVKIEDELKLISKDSAALQNIPSIQPIENDDLSKTGASTGIKIHPFYRIAKMHQGIDFTVPIGTEVFATADGVVEGITMDGSNGNCLIIDHGNGYKTFYAHLSKFFVMPGDKILRRKIIGLSGDSGISIWPHLHYEVHKDGKKCNPVAFFFADLNPQKLKKVFEISSNTGQSLD